MNLRPPGYEPGELPDCSTPRRGPDCSTLVTLVSMWDWAIWAALILVALAGVAALALLFVRVREAWRSFNEMRRTMIRGLDELAASAEAVAEKAAAAEDTAELEETLGRLRVTLARLAVLRAALDEAQVTFRPVTVVLPRR